MKKRKRQRLIAKACKVRFRCVTKWSTNKWPFCMNQCAICYVWKYSWNSATLMRLSSSKKLVNLEKLICVTDCKLRAPWKLLDQERHLNFLMACLCANQTIKPYVYHRRTPNLTCRRVGEYNFNWICFHIWSRLDIGPQLLAPPRMIAPFLHTIFTRHSKVSWRMTNNWNKAETQLITRHSLQAVLLNHKLLMHHNYLFYIYHAATIKKRQTWIVTSLNFTWTKCCTWNSNVCSVTTSVACTSVPKVRYQRNHENFMILITRNP